MRQVTRKGLMTVAAASGVLAVTGGYAVADSGAQGAAVGSPGVLAGNLVQAPVDVPVNVCGNTVDVVGLLNPAFGNHCQNGSGQSRPGGYGDEDGGGHHGGHQSGGGHHGGGHQSGGGAHAGGPATNSPGVGSGNEVQVPVDVPVNACGNNISVIGLLDPVFGNDCANESTPQHPEHPGNPGTPEKPKPPKTPETPEPPKTPETPKPPVERTTPPAPQISVKTPAHTQQLAETGSEVPAGALGAAAAGMLLAGAVVYRKARANA
ncbi:MULTISPECIES: chaplin [Streptomyces]|uniref:Chaplin n=2 Tax=Streptomyces TaxID=1883 RepID=A0ABU2QVK2_9ACTN|nr:MULTISPECIES: chaplin [unclassified Streptomyces]MDT0408033.1 chaplin [Streptomyces sp. DSM 41979]MYQ59403.1 DUF320 domain-containing protein [Streptomyces sp. SID4926]